LGDKYSGKVSSRKDADDDELINAADKRWVSIFNELEKDSDSEAEADQQDYDDNNNESDGDDQEEGQDHESKSTDSSSILVCIPCLCAHTNLSDVQNT
jgi:hypothetical protein